MSFVDPDKPSAAINVISITETSVTVSWSIGETQRVDTTAVYYRVAGYTDWNEVSATGTERDVTPLQPGTEYEFYVVINSFGKTSYSDNIDATTGMMNYHLMFLVLCLSYRFDYLSTNTSW